MPICSWMAAGTEACVMVPGARSAIPLPQRFGQREDTHRAQQAGRPLPAATHAEGEGAPAARHLALGQRVLRVRGQSRVVHLRDRRVPLQPARDGQRVGVVASMRSASVLMPRNTRKQSKGASHVPSAFCR